MSDRGHRTGRLGWLAAEFAMVVLGVVVGLAVDQWRQGRVDADLELEYLRGLRGDLMADTTLVAREVRSAAERRETIESALASLGGRGPFPADTLRILRTLGWALNMGLPTTQNDTYEQLLAQGALGRLDPELGAALGAYYTRLSRQENLFETWDEWRALLERHVMEVLPSGGVRFVLAVGTFSPAEPPTRGELEKTPSPEVLRRSIAILRSDDELLNLPERSSITHRRIGSVGQLWVDQATELLGLVDTEIARLGGGSGAR